MEIQKEHQELIDKAIKLVNKSIQDVHTHLESHVSDKDVFKKLIKLIDTKCFVAGGCFRSVFTNQEVNDVDIFFLSEEDVCEFVDLLSKPCVNVHTVTVTSNNTFTFFKKDNKTPVSFVTMFSGTPEEVVNTFDFTFNQHYYVPQTEEFQFDYGTFTFEGTTVSMTEQENLLNVCYRTFRFLKEGFDIPMSDILNIVSLVSSKHPELSIDDFINAIYNSSTFPTDYNKVLNNIYQSVSPQVFITERSLIGAPTREEHRRVNVRSALGSSPEFVVSTGQSNSSLLYDGVIHEQYFNLTTDST